LLDPPHEQRKFAGEVSSSKRDEALKNRYPSGGLGGTRGFELNAQKKGHSEHARTGHMTSKKSQPEGLIDRLRAKGGSTAWEARLDQELDGRKTRGKASSSRKRKVKTTMQISTNGKGHYGREERGLSREAKGKGEAI